MAQFPYYYERPSWPMSVALRVTLTLVFLVVWLSPTKTHHARYGALGWSLVSSVEAAWDTPYHKRLYELFWKEPVVDTAARVKRNVCIRGAAEILKLHEGFSSKVYKCSRGYWTRGYGEKVASPNVGPVSEGQAYIWMVTKLTSIADFLDENYPWWTKLSQTRRQALLTFIYNIGEGKLDDFPNFMRALEKGNYARAARELLYGANGRSKYWQQVGDRALQLANVIRYGEWEFHQIAENICDDVSPTDGDSPTPKTSVA